MRDSARIFAGAFVLGLAGVGPVCAADVPSSVPVKAVEAQPEKESFGAEANPTGDRVGGGKDYSRSVTEGDYRVRTAGNLLRALKSAKPGQVVYVDDRAAINLTGKQNISIPGGVTLASGRGKGKRRGALLFTTKLGTSALFVTGGEKARITGLRLGGPDRKRRKSAYVAPNSNGIRVRHPEFQIDNCELYGWSHAAIYLVGAGAGHYIHHNYIHHNQRSGLGYGICLNESEALIEANLFDWNRHHIAGTGRPGTSYEARYNLSLEHANSYSFDMHGGRDRKDGTEIGGTWIHIHHNTFKVAHSTGAVLICGIPEREAKVHHNWFLHKDPQKVAWEYYGLDKNMYVYRNLYGPDRRLLGTAIRVSTATKIFREGNAVADAPEGTEFTLAGFENGRYEIEFPVSGGKGPKQRGWIKAADAKIILIGSDEIRARAKLGLVAHYTFDEGSGLAVRDQSGNGNDGKIVVGAKRAKGPWGAAMEFDGVDDYVDCGAKPSLNVEKAGTVMLWFKPEAQQGGLVARSTSGLWEDQRLVLSFVTYQSKVRFTFALADGRQHMYRDLKLPEAGVWTHIAVTFNGSRVKVHKDGSLILDAAQNVSPKVADVPLLLGRSEGLGKPFFKGLIGEVKIYSRALWGEEVQYHHRMTAKRYQGGAGN